MQERQVPFHIPITSPRLKQNNYLLVSLSVLCYTEHVLNVNSLKNHRTTESRIPEDS